MAKRNRETNLPLPSSEIIADYRLAYRSRQVSIVGRREVLSGKAKFGIFGDGKELPQVVIARAFRKGDWRSGYYRDHTWVHAPAIISIFDGGYGISVPNQFQMVKVNIGSILQGFQREPCPAGVCRFQDISPYPAGCICETTTNLPNS